VGAALLSLISFAFRRPWSTANGGKKMATRYQHRIAVRAEICFDLVLDMRNPTPDQLGHIVAEVLSQAADSDGALKLNALPGGVVYPEWNSVDPEVEPNHVLDPSTIRASDCVEIDSIQ
jgi:hypothetical protein